MDSVLSGPTMALVGVIIAATIAGSFSYFTLITAKEQKVSEFRQQWIDALRGSISQYISALSYLSILYHHNQGKGEKRLDKFDMAVSVQETYSQVNKSYNDIVLRINPTEKDSEGKRLNDAFLGALKITREHYLQGNYMDAVMACDTLRETAKPLLKFEWKRVKQGEPRYNRARLFAGTVLAMGLCTAALLFGYLIYSLRNPAVSVPPSAETTRAPAQEPPQVTR